MIDIVGATIGRLFGMVVKNIKQPPLCHCVTPLLKERLVGSHRGELSTQLTEGWLKILFP